jgi:hypothetical protein
MAIVRNGGQGRLSGRRASAAPLTAVSAMARLRFLKAIVCVVESKDA